jgi:ABC-type transport system involved in cytochrome c biogenesis, permease component
MRATIERFLSSYKTTIVLLIIYAVLLAIATFIEKSFGTAMAKAVVYYSPVLFLLQFLMVVNFVYILIERHLLRRRKWGVLFIHFSFVIILLGALVSHLFSQEGILHLREGQRDDRMVIYTEEGGQYYDLPFSVELEKFTLTRYPGSSSPSAFESDLIIYVDGRMYKDRVFMNNVLDIKGYRLFQASYDQDELGTVLSVNRDVAGRNITYTGYGLLLLGFILFLVEPNSRMRELQKQLKVLRSAVKIPTVILLLITLSMTANANQHHHHHHHDTESMLNLVRQNTINMEHAAKFGAMPMQSNSGRMIPINTFSSEVLRKLHKDYKIEGMNPDQFLLSLLAMPDVWMNIPFIINTNDEIAEYFGLTPDACSYIEVIEPTTGRYRLQEKLEEAYFKMPSERSAFDKDIIKLDERINIFHQLVSLQMLNLFPREDDENHKWYASGDDLSVFEGQDSLFVFRIIPWYLGEVQTALSSRDWSKADEVLGMIAIYQNSKNTVAELDPKRIEAELKYNRLDVFRYCKIGYLVLGGLLLILAFLSLFETKKWMSVAKYVLAAAVLIVFHYQMVGMGLRWYIAGHAPWSNSYETMVYIAWVMITVGLMFIRRSIMTFALATLFGGIVLFVSGLSWMDPQINPLVPVLKSPWLMFHVATIVGAYGFFGVSSLLGLTNLVLMCLKKKGREDLLMFRVKEFSLINEMSLHVGVVLMTIGTFIGAVWANESWGRYWGWDPKETWALITMIVYVIVTHIRFARGWYNYWVFNFLSVISILVVLMTFFGVNYFLSGMHSYGSTGAANGVLVYLLLALAAVTVLSILSYIGWKRWPDEKKKIIN